MTISPVRDSNRSSSSKSKLKQTNNTWEIKKRLVKQRLKDLETGESVDTDVPVICYPPKTSSTNDVESSSNVGVSASARARAEKVQANLPPQFPSFVKQMLKSHVSGGFWLGLPSKFCLAHLPKYDGTIVLVDETGEGYDIIYLAVKCGLSGGWRGFSIAHELVEGDVLVFQLIEPCKFKVYIVRAAKLAKVPMIVAKSTNQPEGGEGGGGEAADSLELVPVDQLVSLTEDQSRDKSDNSGSQIMDGIRFSDSPPRFEDVKSLADFNVHVDGLIIDSEIPIHLRSKYYNLCLCQNMFLHRNLMLGLNTKLAAGIISETINIADAIRIAKPSTDLDNLQNWDKTLKAFEDLGMAVGFLRARIHKLLSLVSLSQVMIERKRSERGEVEGEMRGLEKKLLEMRKRIARIDEEMDDLKRKNEVLDGVFTKVGGAPW